MLDAFFDLPAFFQLLVLIVLSGSMLLVSFAWLAWLSRRFASVPKLLPVAAAFGPVTILFALFFSFLASDIWSQERAARDAASREFTALMRLQAFTEPAALNAPDALPMLAAYRHAVSSNEWGSYFNHQASTAAALALRDLRLYGAGLSRDGAPAPLVGQWFKAVDDLEDARLNRLLIGSDHTDNNQWYVVIVLALFAHLTIAAVHMDRPPAGRMVLLFFSVATTLALWQLAMHTNPYNGGFTRVTMPAYLATPTVNE